MRRIMIMAMVAMCWAGSAHADVSVQEKSRVTFSGMVGRMVNMFGGRGARDGITSSVTVKGDRKATRTDQSTQIVDVREEKIYDLDLRDKSYTVTTFADLRRKMDDARRKATEQAAKTADAPAQPSSTTAKPVDLDVSIKESGQRQTINGFDAREVVMTIAVREKGKTLDQSGGMVMTTHIWLAPKNASMKEIADFDRRYAEKLAESTLLDAQQMAAMAAAYPMMRDAMKRFQTENANLSGTPVMTATTMDVVISEEQAASQTKKPAAEEGLPKGLGGLAGRLGRKVVKKDEAPAAAASNRTSVLTMQHDILSISPTINDADLQIPAGFKLR